MTRANALVARARELNPDVRITVTDVLAKVAAQALMRHRDVNVQYADDALLRFPTANVGIAVAAPAGLVVPVVRSVERLSLAELAAARGEVVGRARDGKLTPQDFEDGTFTISNLGMFGIEQFVAVLNPPQAAILAVGATEETRDRHGRRNRHQADDDHDPDRRPSRCRRRRRLRLPAHAEAVRRRPGSRPVKT